MILEKRVLVHITKDITAGNHGALLEGLVWTERPELVLVEAWQLDTSGNENTLCPIGDVFQWSLNSVENSLQNTWSELDRQWFTCSQDGVTVRQAS